jgi:hypothetical protein
MVYKPPAVSGVSKKEWRAYARLLTFASPVFAIFSFASKPQAKPRFRNIIHCRWFYHNLFREIFNSPNFKRFKGFHFIKPAVLDAFPRQLF